MKSNWVYKPIAAEVEMTHQCNLLCGGCAIKDDIKRARYNLTEQEILNFLNQAKELGIYYYALTGGEPFLSFPLLKNIVKKSPLDLIKIDTNGFIFAGPKKTREVFQELKKAGFGAKNKKIKAWLHLSIGQQTIAGIPLENIIFACREFFEFFPKEKTGISLNVFSLNKNYSLKVIDDFLVKYKQITGGHFDYRAIPIKLIPSDLRFCSTALKLNIISNRRKTIRDLVNEYAKEKIFLNCLPKTILLKNGILAPRMLLRANGSVYTCYGFAHVHYLGNIKQDSLKNMLLKANDDLVIKTVFQKGLRGLLKLAERYKPGIGSKILSISYGPCDICQLLKAGIENVITKRVVVASQLALQ